MLKNFPVHSEGISVETDKTYKNIDQVLKTSGHDRVILGQLVNKRFC